MRKIWILAAVLGLSSGGSVGQQQPAVMGWTQLSLSTCKVDEFLRANPQSDGRGVVIAVLDTGVDPAIPGLTTTPDGEPKVIDVQDFTGEGDVELHRVRLDETSGKIIEPNEDGDPIEYTPPTEGVSRSEDRRWWMGTFAEKKLINSDQPDVNDNGTTDDRFPVLVTANADEGDDEALIFVDTSLDRSFADEKPLRSYKLKFDTFTFHRARPEKQIVPLTFAANVFLKRRQVVMHFDDGAHGTHVAGIAAGHNINNQSGFNGVAPGAKVISLKIGNNALGGISTTDAKRNALEYAARFAHERGVPVVCNLSFGVDSEIEGHSDIDKVVNDILRKNPNLVFCTSAGNSGPGLSTMGTPAAATEAISVGALLAADSGRDVFGYSMKEPVVTVFSSRGGELDKPDFAAPGWATSTVPRYVRQGDFWSGTSMASPYAAGMCALLISHVRQAQDAPAVRACDVRQALCLSAKPAPGATPADMGYGIPEAPGAAALLARLVAAADKDPLLGYEISTSSPHGHKGRAPVAYWRGTWFPSEDRQTFTITPRFAPTIDAEQRTSFTRQFELRSKTLWCKVPQQTIYLRSEQPARAFVEYDAEALTKPGLYTGVVEVVADGLVEFRLLSTIAVPYEFTAADNYTRTFKDRTVRGWTPDRYFLAVPAGASAMKLALRAPEGVMSRASMDRLFDPRGEQHRAPSTLDTESGRNEVIRSFAKHLCPGVWEVPVVADRPDKEWPYELRVRFFGLHADPAEISEGKASKPSGKLTVTNLFPKPLSGTADGQIEGFRLRKEDKFKGASDELTYNLSLDGRFDRVRLDLELSPEHYARVTDIAVMVQDDEGQAIYKAGFDWRTHDAVVSTGGAKSLKVVIHAGFAASDDKRETPITVRIDQLLASPVTVKVSQDGESNISFVPGVPIGLEYAAGETLKDIPEGRKPVGYIRVRERVTNDEALRVPIEIGR